jgi:hypothetical protein
VAVQRGPTPHGSTSVILIDHNQEQETTSMNIEKARLEQVQDLVNYLGFRRKEFAETVFTQCHNVVDTVRQTIRTAVALDCPNISDFVDVASWNRNAEDAINALTQQTVKRIKANSTPRTVIQDIDLTFVGVGSKTDMVAVVTLVQTKSDAERIQQLSEEYFANEDRENYCGVDSFLERRLNK